MIRTVPQPRQPFGAGAISGRTPRRSRAGPDAATASATRCWPTWPDQVSDPATLFLRRLAGRASGRLADLQSGRRGRPNQVQLGCARHQVWTLDGGGRFTGLRDLLAHRSPTRSPQPQPIPACRRRRASCSRAIRTKCRNARRIPATRRSSRSPQHTGRRRAGLDQYLEVVPEADGTTKIDNVLFATRRSDTLRSRLDAYARSELSARARAPVGVAPASHRAAPRRSAVAEQALSPASPQRRRRASLTRSAAPVISVTSTIGQRRPHCARQTKRPCRRPRRPEARSRPGDRGEHASLPSPARPRAPASRREQPAWRARGIGDAGAPAAAAKRGGIFAGAGSPSRALGDRIPAAHHVGQKPARTPTPAPITAARPLLDRHRREPPGKLSPPGSPGYARSRPAPRPARTP